MTTSSDTPASTPALTDLVQTSLAHDKVKAVVDEYAAFHSADVGARKAGYTRMVNDYYDLVTDFYEFGWGQSFHFAPRHRGETFEASLARHEFFLASRLGLRPGMTVLDVGCGVGGPMRAIARFSGANVIGINNNDYQIGRGQKQTADAGLADRCRFLKADFMKLPLPDGSVDAIYAIEATCHAPDKAALFKELRRVLKPGGSFAGYEWCLTDKYDGSRADHRAIKKGIEEGDALPDLVHTSEVDGALRAAGFSLVDARDLAPDSDPKTPWYLPLSGRFSWTGWKHMKVGRVLTRRAVQLLEAVKIAPKGATEVSDMLNRAAVALVAGGETGVFTPMYFFHARNE